MSLGKRATAHDRRRDRNLRGLGKSSQLVAGVPSNNSTAAIKNWPFGLFDQADDFVQHDVIGVQRTAIAAQSQFPWPDRLSLRLLNIFWNIDYHWTRPGGLRDIERF